LTMEEGLLICGLTLVLGGVRSGKSGFARSLAETAGVTGRRVYLATAQALDDEMRQRIRRHQEERGPNWTTIEEPLEPSRVVSSMSAGDLVLMDCLTLYLTNLMGQELGDDEILKRVDGLSSAIIESGAAVIVVSNEVGGGVMPVNAMARRFSDLSGLMNQHMASAADRVYLLTAGLPRRLK